MSGAKPDHIVFFDGVCNLCNGFVDFLLRHDKHRKFHVASLQGQTAKQTLERFSLPPLDSIILLENDKIWMKSRAVLQIFSEFGGAWMAVAFILKVVPRFIGDALYDWVAKNRYSWFGKRETCRLPTPEERAYFLD